MGAKFCLNCLNRVLVVGAITLSLQASSHGSDSLGVGQVSTLPLLLSFAVPGLGQVLRGHPVKGLAFMAAEGVAGTMAYVENERNTRHYDAQEAAVDDAVDTALDRLEEIQADPPHSDSILDLVAAQELRIDSLQHRGTILHGDHLNSTQLCNMSLTWLAGVYVYNLMDALETAARLHRPVSGKRAPMAAVWCSLVCPGLGQIYNGSYSKAGMIWMAQAAFGMSAYYRHQTMDYYEAKVKKLQRQSVPDSDYNNFREAQLTDKFNDYRRRRNSFVWYSLGFYFYNVFDALVDAHLHDFDDRPDISFRPDAQSMGWHMTVLFRIPHKEIQTTNKGG